MKSKIIWSLLICSCVCAIAQADTDDLFHSKTSDNILNNETNHLTYDNLKDSAQGHIYNSSTIQKISHINSDIIDLSSIESSNNSAPVQSNISTAAALEKQFITPHAILVNNSRTFDLTTSTTFTTQNILLAPETNDSKDDLKTKMLLYRDENLINTARNIDRMTKLPSTAILQGTSSTEASTDIPTTTQITFTTSEIINISTDLKYSNIASRKERIFSEIGKIVNLTCGTNDINSSLFAENTDNGYSVQKALMQKFSNQSMTNLWKLFWINSTESNAELDGTRVETTEDQVILIISVDREDIFKSMYTCQLQDPSNKVWNVKTVYLERNIGKPEFLHSTSKMSSVLNGSRKSNKINTFEHQIFRMTTSPSQMTNVYTASTQNFQNNLMNASKNYATRTGYSNSNFSFSTLSMPTYEDDSKLKSTDSPFEEEFTKAPSLTTTRQNDTFVTDSYSEDLTTDASGDAIVEHLGKAEEQRLMKEEISNLEGTSSGVALGVAIAALLSAAGTALVLYRRRKVSKKSNYITFGNPSYSRENLPANDYSLESPLTLSSNGYTVLA